MPDVASPWAARHDAIVISLKAPAVSRALSDLELQCRDRISRFHGITADDIDDASNRSKGGSGGTSPRRLGRELDLALAVLWSSVGIPQGKDPNPFRSTALPHIKNLSRLSFTIDDFKSLKTLQRSSGSFVEVVRCKLNRQLYVLKTIVKGFAKRNAAIQSPTCETLFLAKRNSDSAKANANASVVVDRQWVTPELVAAFQTQGSVHLVMEYVPGGDLSELLVAASKCGPRYPGRASTGLLVEDWVHRYTVDMILAIGWIHAEGYAHRDIKPGNFLLDRSGHLKLCDFSSAAPFSQFQVPEPSRDGERVWARKVHSFYCSLPTGTCDYLSPELLEAEEERIARRQLSFQSFDEGDLPWKRAPQVEARPDDVEPGPYGPEMDWWSLGIMLYEMRCGVLPFFSDQMQATYELIRNHRESLRFDPEIEVSEPLLDLMRRLLTDPHHRLGRNGTFELQQHAFFCGVDWSAEWPLEPPFVPNVGEATAAAAPGGSEPDLSVIHSPGVFLPGELVAASGSLSAVDTLPDFSALYSGDLDDFPAYTDSRDFDQQDGMTSSRSYDIAGWSAEIAAGASVEPEVTVSNVAFGLPRSSLPAIVDATSSPTPVRSSAMATLPSSTSRLGAFSSTPRWSDCDLALVGFSYVPDAAAFQPAPQPSADQRPVAVASKAVAFETLSCEPSSASLFLDTGGASPAVWTECEPMASTPQERIARRTGATLPDIPSTIGLPTLPSYVPSPAAPWSVERDPKGEIEPLEAEAEAEPEAEQKVALPNSRLHSFVTPARKPSYICLADQYAAAVAGGRKDDEMRPTFEPSVVQQTPAVPQSPYPFPMATANDSMPSVARKRGAALRRNDLARARSATPGAGSVGSDSRYSGGSNAVREVSESQAWDEMMAAVQKSVRKQQQQRKQHGASRSPISTWPRRHQPSPAVKREAANASVTGPSTGRRANDTPDHRGFVRSRPTLALPSLATIAPSPDAKSATRGSVHELDEGGSNDEAEVIGGIASRRAQLTFPESREASSGLAPHQDHDAPAEEPSNDGSLTTRLQAPPAFAIYADDSDASDNSCSSGGEGDHGRPALKHKRSARQLLIKAQERSTPTKPTRTQSPSLREAHAARIAGFARGASSPLSFNEHTEPFSSSPREMAATGVDAAGTAATAAARARPISMLTLCGRHEAGSSSPANCSTENLSSSSGHGSSFVGSHGTVPMLGAISLVEPDRSGGGGVGSGSRLDTAFDDAIAGSGRRSLRADSLTAREIKRKSSRDMLSEYRRGIGRPSSMSAVKSMAKGSSSIVKEDAFGESTSLAAAAGVARNGNGERDAFGKKERRRFSSAVTGRSRQTDLPSSTTEIVKAVPTAERRRRASESLATRGSVVAPAASAAGGRRASQQRPRGMFLEAPLQEDPHELSSPEKSTGRHSQKTRAPQVNNDQNSAPTGTRTNTTTTTTAAAQTTKVRHLRRTSSRLDVAHASDRHACNASQPQQDVAAVVRPPEHAKGEKEVSTRPLRDTTNDKKLTRRISSLTIGNSKPFPRTQTPPSPRHPQQGGSSSDGSSSVSDNKTSGTGGGKQKSLSAEDVHRLSSRPPPSGGGKGREKIRRKWASEKDVVALASTEAGRDRKDEDETRVPAEAGDVSLMTGLRSCHSALQGSLLELEVKLAQIKKRLEQ